jgi:hypothetical protein
MWAEGFQDRDGKFVEEFQTNGFNACWWELYLFACLKELNSPVDFSHHAPDFVATAPAGLHFCIEAVTANHARGERGEWQRDENLWEELKSADVSHIVDVATIRLASSMASKHKKFRESYSSLNHVSRHPFVLAVAPFEQPMFWNQNQQSIRRVLFALDGINHETHESEGVRIIQGNRWLDTIRKSNGSDVPLGCFTNAGMEEISAVMFSSVATWGKARALSQGDGTAVIFETARYTADEFRPRHELALKSSYRESLLDGLQVFHNPYAKHPLPREVFASTDVTQQWWDFALGTLMNDARDGTLLQRSVLAIPNVSADVLERSLREHRQGASERAAPPSGTNE